MSHEELLSTLVHYVLEATRSYQAGQIDEGQLPSAADMARCFHLDLDYLKKKLRLLKKHHLLQTVSFSPKRYRFDTYAFRELDEDSELYAILRDPESEFFLDL